MTISVPDTFTSDFSEKYIMSIRLWSGGLSFSAYNPEEGHTFFVRELEFNRARPYIEWLKEDVFFANECLTWSYKRTSVLYVSAQYTLAPNRLVPEKKKAQLLAFNFPAPGKRCLSNPVEAEDAQLVFGVNEEVYEFCSRSLTHPVFTHHIGSQLIMLGKQSRNGTNSRMFVILHRKMVDIVCFAAGRLVFVNSFHFEQLNDLLYYILCVWKQTGMNQLNDALFLAGDISLTTRITHFLQTYIQHVGRMEIPAKTYLLGGEILQAPVDLLLFSVCE
jgi:hypothetical protein